MNSIKPILKNDNINCSIPTEQQITTKSILLSTPILLTTKAEINTFAEEATTTNNIKITTTTQINDEKETTKIIEKDISTETETYSTILLEEKATTSMTTTTDNFVIGQFDAKNGDELIIFDKNTTRTTKLVPSFIAKTTKNSNIVSIFATINNIVKANNT